MACEGGCITVPAIPAPGQKVVSLPREPGALGRATSGMYAPVRAAHHSAYTQHTPRPTAHTTARCQSRPTDRRALRWAEVAVAGQYT